MTSAPSSWASRLKAATPWLVLLWALLLLVVLQPYAAGYGAFRRSILEIIAERWRDATWQHGALALPIAAWLLWRRRAEFEALPARWSGAGLGMLVFGLLLYFAGYRANFYYFGFAAIHLMIGGFVLWVHGWERFKLCLFPWFILCFAWPIVFLEDSAILLNLRITMVRCAAAVLSLAGVPTITDGTTLVSAATEARAAGDWFRFNVDGPCSGLRSVFALLMVSAIFGYFREKQLLRRMLLIVSSIPLALLANMVRIFILLGGSMLFGQSFAVGDEEKEVSTFHFLAGIAVFVVALAGMQALSALMSFVFDREKRARTVRRVNVAGGRQPEASPS